MKFFNDSIHGLIELSDIAVSIVDTPIFQRLRDIKQLGTCFYVFPTADHSRFEHSIGVAHLAKELAFQIKSNQPDLTITNHDILNLEIAGLCHDLGHGPNSHAFDDEFIKNNKDYNKIQYPTHEERSCCLLRYLVNKYNIKLSKESLDIICEMINPTKKHDSFIYYIVSNSKNGIDVDKFDYLVRDTTKLGLKYGFDHNRLFKKCRVIDNDICFPKKEAYNVLEMFNTRYRLHKKIYNHPVVKGIEYMIVDILEYINLELNLVDYINDMSKYYLLTDSLFEFYKYSNNESENITKIKKLNKRISMRDIYKFVCEIRIHDLKEFDKLNIIFKHNNLVIGNDILIQKMYIGLTGKEEHPLNNIKFYNKNDISKVELLDIKTISGLLSEECREKSLRFFVKDKSNSNLVKNIIKNYYDIISF